MRVEWQEQTDGTKAWSAFPSANIDNPILLAWFVVWIQTVDATPSNQLIRQCFPWRTDLYGRTRSEPNQGSVPSDLA
jgi:hypothetical protein